MPIPPRDGDSTDPGNATLDQAGGKGASLIRMATAGLPVPAGFVLTTEAYRRFVAANNLEPVIATRSAVSPRLTQTSWARAATTIRDQFERGRHP